ncbi:hypothetical protein N2152v2_001842 [Parachlorella kessleri]
MSQLLEEHLGDLNKAGPVLDALLRAACWDRLLRSLRLGLTSVGRNAAADPADLASPQDTTEQELVALLSVVQPQLACACLDTLLSLQVNYPPAFQMLVQNDGPQQVSALLQSPTAADKVRSWGARFLNLLMTHVAPSLVGAANSSEVSGSQGTEAAAEADGVPNGLSMQQSLEAARAGVEEVLGRDAAALLMRKVNLQEGQAEMKLEQLGQALSFFLQHYKERASSQQRQQQQLGSVELGAARPGCQGNRHVVHKAQRLNLVVTAADNKFKPSGWLSHKRQRTFEVVLINYSKEPAACTDCYRVFNLRGPKWRIVYLMTQSPEWRELLAERPWEYISFADDDLLEVDTCVFNTLFHYMKAYDLLMGQPAVCDRYRAFSVYDAVRQRRNCLLHYTNFIEVMSPTFPLDFFLGVVQPTLYNAWSGWGLDFVWAHLLQYPPDKMGVIDEVCILHFDRGRGHQGSMYSASALPKPAQQELEERVAEYKGLVQVEEDLGQAHRNTKVLSCVPRPQPATSPQPGALWNNLLLLVVAIQGGLLLGCTALLVLRRGSSISNRLRLGNGRLQGSTFSSGGAQHGRGSTSHQQYPRSPIQQGTAASPAATQLLAVGGSSLR